MVLSVPVHGGTAIAVLLVNNGHEVALWSAIPAEIEEMAKTRTHRNLPGVTLPEGLIYTADLEKAMADKDLLVDGSPVCFRAQYGAEDETVL